MDRIGRFLEGRECPLHPPSFPHSLTLSNHRESIEPIPRPVLDRFSVSNLDSQQCFQHLTYKVCCDISIRSWYHPEHVLVHGRAAAVFTTLWAVWNPEVEVARLLVKFCMTKIIFEADLDQLITQLNKYYGRTIPISFVEAAIASFQNQRCPRYGKLPGPSYRCDTCGGAHLKERCPLLHSTHSFNEIIGIAEFCCEICHKEWRSSSTGIADRVRCCMRCRQNKGLRRWFVETCTSSCHQHCPRVTHAVVAPIGAHLRPSQRSPTPPSSDAAAAASIGPYWNPPPPPAAAAAVVPPPPAWDSDHINSPMPPSWYRM